MEKQKYIPHTDTNTAFLASLVLYSDDAIEGLSLDGNVIVWNRGCEELYGYTAKEIMGKSILMVYPEDRLDEFPLIIAKIKNGEHIDPYVTQRKRKDGGLIDVAVSASPIKDKKGVIIGVSKISRPFAGQERVAQYTRSLIEASLDPLVTISTTGKITDVNEATIKVTGVSRKELIGTDFSNYFTEPKKAQEGYEQVFKKGFVIDYPLIIRHKGGRLTDVLYNASVYKDDKDNVLGIFAAARDVTGAKKAFHYARSLIEASLDPLVTISPEGKITDVNDATVQVTGVMREQLIGSDFSNYFTEPGKAMEGYRLVFSKGNVTDYPLTIRHANGRTTDVLYNASVYKDEQGNVLGVFAAARDNSRAKKNIQQLESSNQELDAFTYSVAHDLKEPLRAIDGFSKILMEDYSKKMGDDGKRLISIICDNTGKMGKLIEDLLALSRIGRCGIKKEHLNPKLFIDSICKELIAIHPNREISIDIKELPDSFADKSLMRQVWVNLISNAIKFTQTKKKALIEIGGSKDENNFVTYYIKDNGLGFDMKYADKLFGVFQRLHGQEIEGTGVGLANVKRIIMRHGGQVRGIGKIGEGATFSFTLPKD